MWTATRVPECSGKEDDAVQVSVVEEEEETEGEEEEEEIRKPKCERERCGVRECAMGVLCAVCVMW